MDKYISVITNFGCHYSCPYCIVKNNDLHIPKSTVEGLNSLISEAERGGCNWISLSGGGDPLWEYQSHKDWYRKFFDIATDYKIELHTSIPNVKTFPYFFFNRVVYHLHSYDQLKTIKRDGDEIVRVVFVVTENFTEELIDKIANFCQESSEIDELSFRQMVDDHYQDTYYCQEYLREGHQKRWWYIEQCDYNLYYCENKVYTEYKNIGVDQEKEI